MPTKYIFRRAPSRKYIVVAITLLCIVLFGSSVYIESSWCRAKYELEWREEVRSLFSESRRLPRIACLVMTHPENSDSRVPAVNMTWGKHCDILRFMSARENSSIVDDFTMNSTQSDIIYINVRSGRDHLWKKTRLSFIYAYFQLLFKPFVEQGYMSGGAGYVLSREALRRFAQEGNVNNERNQIPECSRNDLNVAEDVQMGKCMESLTINAEDTRDSQGRQRFLPFGPMFFLDSKSKKVDFWFWDYAKDPINTGFNCCSKNPISFHYVKPMQMYLIYYLVYDVNSEIIPEKSIKL